jgi:peroxiredoxin
MVRQKCFGRNNSMKKILILLFIFTILQQAVCYSTDTEENGQYFPRFVLETIDGEKHSLSSLSGKISDRKIILISFFASDCKPCKSELHDFIEIRQKYNKKDVEIVYISIENERNLRKAIMRGNDIFSPADFEIIQDNFLLLVDDNKELYKQIFEDKINFSIPAAVIIDKDRRIAFKQTGYTPNLSPVLQNTIDELLEKPVEINRNDSDEITLVFSGMVSGSKSLLLMRRTLLGDLIDIFGNVYLFSTGDINGEKFSQERTIDFFNMVSAVGYRGIVPGDQEFISGSKPLAQCKVPLVSCNLSSEVIPIEKSIILEIGGLKKIGIIGVNDPKAFIFLKSETRNEISLDERYIDRVKDQIDALKKQGIDYCVLLAHGGKSFVNEIGSGLKGIDLIIGGHEAESYESVIQDGATTIINTRKNGKRVDVVRIRLSDKKIVEHQCLDVKELY